MSAESTTLEELKETFPVFTWSGRDDFFRGTFEVEDAVRLDVVLRRGDKELLLEDPLSDETLYHDVPEDWSSWSSSLTVHMKGHSTRQFRVPWYRVEEGPLQVDTAHQACAQLVEQVESLHRIVAVSLSP